MPKKAEKWYVYILLCADDTLYTGITNDLPRRHDQHNKGKAARYTRSKKRRPTKIVYRETAKSKGAALSREYAIKQLPRAKKEELIKSKAKKGKKG